MPKSEYIWEDFVEFQVASSRQNSDRDKCVQCLTEYAACTEIEKISSGSFGVVFQCKLTNPSMHHISDDEVDLLAAKVYYFNKDSNKFRILAQKTSFTNDVKLLNSCKHPNILKTYSSFQVYEEYATGLTKVVHNCCDLDNNSSHQLRYAGLFMEKLDCSVKDLAKTMLPNALPETERKDMFRQIGSALAYIHRTLLTCHMDINADNIGIMMPNDGRRQTYKLIDFGNAVTHRKEVYDEYANNASTIGSNPFVSEAHNFAGLIMKLAKPYGISVRNRDVAKEVAYEDDDFKNVLLLLTSSVPEEIISLDQALQQIQ